MAYRGRGSSRGSFRGGNTFGNGYSRGGRFNNNRSNDLENEFGYQPVNSKRKFDEDNDEEGGYDEDDSGYKGSFPQKKPKLTDEEIKERNAKKEKFLNAKLKAWRLIIRNLPFKTKREDIQNVCSNFGPFSEIVLPPSKKDKKYCAGFGFIQFKTQESAEKAREYLNSNKFMGRDVACDWALAKDTFETSNHDEKEKLKKIVKVEKVETKEEANEDEEEDEEDNSGSEEDEESEAEEEKIVSKKEKKKGKKEEKKEDKSINEGKVVFLRNLSFETKEEALKEEMARFGKVTIALICKYKESGHSKGTAFVHFSTKEEAEACIQAAENGLFIDNRLIKVTPAIQRQSAAEIETNRLKKVPKDNRNLRLIRFGLIRDGTDAAKGMSKEDATRREKLAEAARKKLEISHMFISPTRLCIHNIPPKYDDYSLRNLVKKATSDDAVVTECRIWRDKERLDAKGQPKSSGFGFVNFSEHKHALECLQKLNNNKETFTNERRPIVEFSIENLNALQAKARRTAKSVGESASERQLNEKIKKQVRDSVGEVHASGMKFLPKFLGKKNRHRDLTGKAKKKVEGRAFVKAQKFGKQQPAANPEKKKSKKNVTKFLSLST